MGVCSISLTAKGGTTQTGAVIPTPMATRSDTPPAPRMHGGYTPFPAQYGKGAASNFSTSIEDPTRSEELRAIGDCRTFAPSAQRPICHHADLHFSTESGTGSRDTGSTLGMFGVRPEVFFTKYLSSRSRPGLTHRRFCHDAKREHPVRWLLRKFTIAPQIGAGRKFFSRPCCVRF